MISGLRFLFGVVVLGTAILAVNDYRNWHHQRAELVDYVESGPLGERYPTAVSALGLERTALHAKLRVARLLVHEVLHAQPAGAEPRTNDPGVDDGETPPLVIGSASWSAAVDQLDTAATLAREVLEETPQQAEALTMLGAAIYLQGIARRDPRLFDEPERWEEPLLAALRAALGAEEPRRFLALAYVGLWRSLPPERRQRTRELLTEAFREDQVAFRLLLPSWMAAAGSREEVFEVMPAQARRWRELEKAYADAQDWRGFRATHQRYREILEAELQADFDEAVERMRLGEGFHSRSLLLQIVTRAPRDKRFAPLVGRALERYPAGLHGLASTAELEDWLHWALDLAAVDQEGLPPHVVGRLAGVVENLQPPTAALAAITAGEITNAERLETLSETLAIEPWGPYLVAKARWLLGRSGGDSGLSASGMGDGAAQAAELLQLADVATRRTVSYARARLEVARNHGQLADLADAERRLDDLRKREWPATGWRMRQLTARMTILPAAADEGLTLRLNRVPEGGAVVAAAVDGGVPEIFIVPEDGEIVLPREISAEPHLVELKTLAGGRLLPGRLRLGVQEVGIR